MDRREVLLGAEAGHVDGVLAVGEDLLVLPCGFLALAPRVRRTLREPRGAALVVLALVALGRGPVCSSSEPFPDNSMTPRATATRRAACARPPPVWKSKFYGAFVLNHRVVLHVIDATPARWRGDAGSSPKK